MITVFISGKEYKLNVVGDEECARRAAEYVERQMRDLGTQWPEFEEKDVAVLISLNLSYQLFSLKEKSERFTKDLETVNQRIDEVLREV